VAVEMIGCGDALGCLEDLRERRGQILGVLGGAIIDQHAVAVVAVCCATLLYQAIERIVDRVSVPAVGGLVELLRFYHRARPIVL
jgi:hypothetical protein